MPGSDYLTEGHIRASVITSEPNKEKYRNVVEGLKCIAIGSNISAMIQSGGNRPDNSALFGQNIFCESSNCLAAGYNLRVNGSGMGRVVFGQSNNITSSASSIVAGQNNSVINSNQSVTVGSDCKLQNSEYSVAIGNRITIDNKKSSIVLNADYLNGYVPSKAGAVCLNPYLGELKNLYIGQSDFIECVIKAIEQSSDDQKSRIKTALGL